MNQAKAPKTQSDDREEFDFFLKDYAAFAADNGLLPVKITPFYLAGIREEVSALGHRDGPLHRVAYPPRERAAPDPTQSPADYLGDRLHQKEGGKADRAIIHKYGDRLLFMPTTACAGHCQYCFRQDFLTQGARQSMLQFETRLAVLADYLAKTPGVHEVILSGGDPLTLSTNQFRRIFDVLKSRPQVTDIRIHTRGLVFSPQALDDAEKIALFVQNRVRMVFHIVHPYEIRDEVRAALARLRGAGLRLYNQFPILRGVNDHPRVLKKLMVALDEEHVRPLSVFAPDPVSHTHPYRVSVSRLLELMDALRRNSPSWVGNVPLVFDTPAGKVYRDNLVTLKEDGNALFRRGEAEFSYPGFPPALDRPGDPSNMLWRDNV